MPLNQHLCQAEALNPCWKCSFCLMLNQHWKVRDWKIYTDSTFITRHGLNVEKTLCLVLRIKMPTFSQTVSSLHGCSETATQVTLWFFNQNVKILKSALKIWPYFNIKQNKHFQCGFNVCVCRNLNIDSVAFCYLGMVGFRTLNAAWFEISR